MHNYVTQYVYHYNPLHVSSKSVLIITRSNCINTASGIVPSQPAHRAVTYREYYTRCCINTI